MQKTLWEVADVIEQIYTIAFTTNLQPDPEDREAAILDHRAEHKVAAQSGPSGFLVAAALTRRSSRLVCARRQNCRVCSP
jgi:hypothetical protein